MTTRRQSLTCQKSQTCAFFQFLDPRITNALSALLQVNESTEYAQKATSNCESHSDHGKLSNHPGKNLLLLFGLIGKSIFLGWLGDLYKTFRLLALKS